jgi:flagellar motor switch protein FliG
VEKRSTDRPESRPARLSGLKKAAEMLNQMGAGRDTEILEQLSAQDQELGTRIRELMFVFENLLQLDDRSVQALMREISTDVLVVALKGADADVRDKLMRNMSQRAPDPQGRHRRAARCVERGGDAQKEILTTVQRLAEEGKVMLSRGGEQFV